MKFVVFIAMFHLLHQEMGCKTFVKPGTKTNNLTSSMFNNQYSNGYHIGFLQS